MFKNRWNSLTKNTFVSLIVVILYANNLNILIYYPLSLASYVNMKKTVLNTTASLIDNVWSVWDKGTLNLREKYPSTLSNR